MDPIIIASDLYKSYGDVQAVRGVSFTVEPGHIFGLLGHNGAGKTTTIKMLTGRLLPDRGTASIAGYDVLRQTDQIKPIIGTVWEEQNLYERLTAADNLEFAGQLYEIADMKRRVAETLDLVGLGDRANSKVQTFSNGMKQRLIIARALLHRPRLLFLDEPSRGLDPASAREVREIIGRLRDGGTTILLTTHLMEEADALCSRIAFLRAGQVVVNDTPLALKLAHGRREVIVRLSRPVDALPVGEPITLDLTTPATADQLARLVDSGAIETMHTREATLEEVFLAVAGPRPHDDEAAPRPKAGFRLPKIA
jgi:ABC-2 type transport system ATP-binding protein